MKKKISFLINLNENEILKIFRHAEYESARRDLNFFTGKELELLVFLLFPILKEFELVWSTC